jgi:hypothetical protein
MQNVLRHFLRLRGQAHPYVCLRLVMTAIALFCGSAGYGAVTPTADDDIVVTVAHASIQEHARAIANHPVFPQSLSQRESLVFHAATGSSTPSASMFSSPLGVCLTGLCRSNR